MIRYHPSHAVITAHNYLSYPSGTNLQNKHRIGLLQSKVPLASRWITHSINSIMEVEQPAVFIQCCHCTTQLNTQLHDLLVQCSHLLTCMLHAAWDTCCTSIMLWKIHHLDATLIHTTTPTPYTSCMRHTLSTL